MIVRSQGCKLLTPCSIVKVTNLRKGLTILGLLFIILIVSSETVFPWLVRATIQTKLSQKAATDDVQATLGSTPSALLMLGNIQQLDVVMHQAKIGQVYLRELTLSGSDVQLDMPALLREEGIQVRRADKLELKGIVDADNLREVLSRKVDKIENVQVAIHPDKVQVTANAKVFGRVADIELDGQVVEDSGSLYFLMTRLDMKNTRLGTARLGDLFGNIQLAAPDRLPLGMKVRQVQQTEGAIIITAERDGKD